MYAQARAQRAVGAYRRSQLALWINQKGERRAMLLGKLFRKLPQIVLCLDVDLVRKNRIAIFIAQVLRLFIEPARVHRRLKAPDVLRQWKIMAQPRHMIFCRCIIQHWIFPRAHRAFEIGKFKDRNMRARGRPQNGHVLLGSANRSAQCKRETGEKNSDFSNHSYCFILSCFIGFSQRRCRFEQHSAKLLLTLLLRLKGTENGYVPSPGPYGGKTSMRYLIAFLALAGIVVSVLAFRIHYSNDVQPCDINARWDCGTVNHSRYSMVGPVPVAAIGVAGYLALGVLALMRRRSFTLITALLGLGYALYLTNIEAHKLEVWCLYCVSSQIIIALITLFAGFWAFLGSPPPRRHSL